MNAIEQWLDIDDPHEPPVARFVVNWALFTAASYGQVEAVARLLQDPRVNLRDDTDPIYLAAAQGQLQIVELLLNAGMDPYGVIAVAAEHGQVEIVELLLNDKRVNPADEDNDAIRSAARCGHL